MNCWNTYESLKLGNLLNFTYKQYKSYSKSCVENDMCILLYLSTDCLPNIFAISGRNSLGNACTLF